MKHDVQKGGPAARSSPGSVSRHVVNRFAAAIESIITCSSDSPDKEISKGFKRVDQQFTAFLALNRSQAELAEAIFRGSNSPSPSG